MDQFPRHAARPAGTVRLSRAAMASAPPEYGRLRAAPPARIVHFGLGAFHRSHQAWYTDQVDTRGEWGIAAFTGRSSGRETALADQQGLYTLIERAAAGDRATVVGSLAATHTGTDLGALTTLFGNPGVAIVTITVTEAGYHLQPAGRATGRPALDADVDRLRRRLERAELPAVVTMPGRLLLGLDRRRLTCGAPIAVVPCDNMPANGEALRASLLALAQRIDDGLADWIAREVSFVSTVVDRITPATTAHDLEVARESTGFDDHSPVVTEPFHDWILEGEFPVGRPRWEDAGARFVPSVEPFERRKLRMLNGGHTLLACVGLGLGHSTVAEAVADPQIRRLLERFWDEAAATIPAEANPAAYRGELLARFSNPRIRHTLAQIALDSPIKLRLRILPVLEAARAAGRSGEASIATLAAWLRLDEQNGTDLDRRARLAALDEDIVVDERLTGAILAAAGSR